MNFRKILIYAFFHIPYYLHKITGTGAFGINRATYIESPVANDNNLLKTGLIRYHVKQYNEASCSVATVVSVINAIRALNSNKPVIISQMDILEKVKTANWKKRMSSRGDNGKRGLPLNVLDEVVKSSLDVYEINYKKVEIVQALKDRKKTQKIKSVLWERLNEFEKNGNSIIIAHFDQGAYVQTLNIPHISPVGSFDAKSGDVVILDVDPDQLKPYKISFDTFYKGLSCDYCHFLKPFGFGSGGYIFIAL